MQMVFLVCISFKHEEPDYQMPRLVIMTAYWIQYQSQLKFMKLILAKNVELSWNLGCNNNDDKHHLHS